MAAQKWSAASEVLTKIIQEKPMPVYLRSLVEALFNDHQYVEGMQYVLEHHTCFYHDRQSAELAVRVLLADQDFIDARLFIVGGPAKWLTFLEHLVKTGEDHALNDRPATIRQELRQFYHLGDLNPRQQEERLHDAFHLPLTTFLQGTQFVLRDPFVNPLVRADIIDILRKLRVKQEVTYAWLDGHEYQTRPSHLQSVEENQNLQKVKAIVKQQLANDDPIYYQMTDQQLKLQALLLYPRIDQVITEPKEWADCLIDTINGNDYQGNGQTREWQEKLRDEITKLTR